MGVHRHPMTTMNETPASRSDFQTKYVVSMDTFKIYFYPMKIYEYKIKPMFCYRPRSQFKLNPLSSFGVKRLTNIHTFKLSLYNISHYLQ